MLRSCTEIFFIVLALTMSRLSSTFKIVGAWTKAGVASCVQIKSPIHPHSILLDCGSLQNQNAFGADVVLVTHGHLDHAGCCIHHARGRSLTNTPATYYIPKSIEAPLLKAKSAFEEMDGREIPMKIISVSPNDSVMLSKNLKAVVFETEHRVESQGYALYSINKGSLLPEYQQFSSDEIKRLRSEGKSILSPPTERLELVYTGDTTLAGLLKPENAFIFQSPLLIMELTYLDGDYDKAVQWHHIHIDDLLRHPDLFDATGKLVFVHLSQKYSYNRAVELLRTQLPHKLLSKSAVNLFSFDCRDILTELGDPLTSSTSFSSSSSQHAHSQQRWQETRKLPGWGWTRKHYDNNNNNNNYNDSNHNTSSATNSSNGTHGNGEGRQSQYREEQGETGRRKNRSEEETMQLLTNNNNKKKAYTTNNTNSSRHTRNLAEDNTSNITATATVPPPPPPPSLRSSFSSVMTNRNSNNNSNNSK